MGDEINSIRNLSGRIFHISEKRMRSMNEVIAPCPRTRHEPLILPSRAFEGALLKMCSAYLAISLIKCAIDPGEEVARPAGKCLSDKFQIRSAVNTEPALNRVLTSANGTEHRLSFCMLYRLQAESSEGTCRTSEDSA